MTLSPNLGAADRTVRVILGLIAGGVAVWLYGSVAIWIPAVLAVVAAVLLVTAAIKRCPAYMPLGVSTCPMQQDDA